MGLMKKLAEAPMKAVFSTPKPLGTPEWAAEIYKVKLRPGDTATVWVRVWTGEETIWQGPRETSIRTAHPEGRPPQVGQRVVVQMSNWGDAEAYVHWDKPAPEPPPMIFPAQINANDPLTAIEQLQQMIQARTLQPEDFERAKRYLLDGGWGPPPEK